ncbi:MAG: hypothetical protein GC202_14340 [Alphaproteobacteria bacterium]|nr:hypothetical protein [Alphaproteobacteria bacterium]
MIVAVSASPLVDRTAHARKLAGPRGAILSDPSRALVRAAGFQTLYEVPKDLQTELRLKLFSDHAKALSRAKGDLVADHCAVEWMADWMRWHWAAVSTRAWDAAMDKAAKIVKRYSRIEHLASGPPRGYDGYAWLDRPNARQVEELMFFLYGKFGAKVVKVG